MTTREKVYSVLAILAIAAAVFTGREWLREHDARARAESTAAAESQIIATAQKQIDAAQADAKQTAAQLTQQLAAIEAQKQRPVTAPQFVVDLSKVIPNLPQAATVIQQPAQAQIVNGKTETAPPQQAVEIPAADLPALQTYKLNCDATGLKLDACTKTSADLQEQLAGSRDQLAAETKIAKSWESAAKGGSIWSRLTHGAKCLAISGAAAYAGSRVDVKDPGVGAVIGTVAGGIGCQVF
jgi:hypothetical protein